MAIILKLLFMTFSMQHNGTPSIRIAWQKLNDNQVRFTHETVNKSMMVNMSMRHSKVCTLCLLRKKEQSASGNPSKNRNLPMLPSRIVANQEQIETPFYNLTQKNHIMSVFYTNQWGYCTPENNNTSSLSYIENKCVSHMSDFVSIDDGQSTSLKFSGSCALPWRDPPS